LIEGHFFFARCCGEDFRLFAYPHWDRFPSFLFLEREDLFSGQEDGFFTPLLGKMPRLLDTNHHREKELQCRSLLNSTASKKIAFTRCMPKGFFRTTSFLGSFFWDRLCFLPPDLSVPSIRINALAGIFPRSYDCLVRRPIPFPFWRYIFP